MDSEYLNDTVAALPTAPIYSTLVRSIASDIEGKISDLGIRTQKILSDLAIIDSTALLIATWTDGDILQTNSDLFNATLDSIIPDFNTPIQETAVCQTTYNQYVEEMRSVADYMTDEAKEQLGITSMMPYFTEKFVSSAVDILVGMVESVFSSYALSEFDVMYLIYKLVNSNTDINTIFDDIIILLQSFLDCGGNETKWSEYGMAVVYYLWQLPVNNDFRVLPEYVIGLLSIDYSNKQKLLDVYTVIRPSLNNIKIRTEPLPTRPLLPPLAPPA